MKNSQLLKPLNLFKILVFGASAGYFAFIVLSGRWAYYIDPRFQWLSVVAVVLFSLLALTHIFSGSADNEDLLEGEDHNRVTLWPILIALVPLFLGIVIPAKPLGADALKTRGVDTSFNSVSLSVSSSESLTIVPSERNILDWARAIASRSEENSFNGEEANVVGFVFRDSRFEDNQFMITRFTISCCVADALAVGLVVEIPEGSVEYEPDTWLRVEGTFQETLFDGDLIPILFAENITPVEQPAQPYLYQ